MDVVVPSLDFPCCRSSLSQERVQAKLDRVNCAKPRWSIGNCVGTRRRQVPSMFEENYRSLFIVVCQSKYVLRGGVVAGFGRLQSHRINRSKNLLARSNIPVRFVENVVTGNGFGCQPVISLNWLAESPICTWPKGLRFRTEGGTVGFGKARPAVPNGRFSDQRAARRPVTPRNSTHPDRSRRGGCSRGRHRGASPPPLLRPLPWRAGSGRGRRGASGAGRRPPSP